MVVSVTMKREYVPKFNDNDKLNATEQIKILHKPPTIAIKERLFPKKFEFDGSGDVTGSFEIDRQRILREFITEIRNLSYLAEDEANVKVKDAVSLFACPPEFDPLIDELYNYFQELLNKKTEEKN